MRLKNGFLLLMVAASAAAEVLPSIADVYKLDIGLENLNFSAPCLKDLKLVRNNLKNFTHWAFQIWDSSAKEPTGLTGGSMFQLGNFDECLVVDREDSINHGPKRQYCLLNVTIQGPDIDQGLTHTRPYLSAFDDLLDHSDPARVRRDVIRWALCAPASCSHRELVVLVKEIMPDSYYVSLESKNCQLEDVITKPFSIESKICMSLLTIFCVLSLGASSYHWFLLSRSSDSPNDVKPPPAVKSYSLIYQSKRLFMCTSNTKLRSLNGIRFFSICIIICGHRFGISMSSAVSNRAHFEQILEGPELMFATHTDLVVDTFLVLSALLATITIMKKESLPAYSLPLVVIYRLLRLLPLYGAVLMIVSTVSGEWGSGPLWGQIAASEAEFCRQNWWLNLLMINNYINSDQLCMVHSWYLPVDFHLFVLALGFLWWMRTHPRPVLIILTIGLIISIVIPSYITYAMRLPPTLLFYDDFLTNQRAHRYFQYLYIKTHTRMSPYILGIFTGFLLHYYRNNPKKLSRAKSGLVFIALLLGILALLMSGSVFHDSSRPFSPLEAAMYAGLHRFLWGFVLCAMILCCAFGTIPIVSDILEWSGWSPLAKLTYGAYLIHMPLQLRSVSVARQPFFLEFYHSMSLCFGDVTFAFILSMILFFIVEGPLDELSTLIFFPNGISTHNNSSTNDQEINNGTYINKNCISMEEKSHDPENLPSYPNAPFTIRI